MLSVTEIEKAYPAHLRTFKSFLLREYLQYKILEIIFNSEYSKKLCFLGGTCLRIVHNNSRFSEDLDFDNLGLTEKQFEKISIVIKKNLEAEGYVVEMKNVLKGAYHCHIQFPGLLFQEGLSGHKEEKILIQLDTESQNYSFKTETVILNKFDVFTQINIVPSSLLLSQKLFALLNRKRPKGRDFFDVVFLLSFTKPDYKYLKLKTGITDKEKLRATVLKRCSNIEMKEMVKDVQSFLFNSKDAKKILLFPEYFERAQL